MLISESYINETEGYQIGDTEPYEPFTDDVGELFRHCQREFGRCRSKVYVDTDDGSRAIGWVFEKLDAYEDAGGHYLRHVWVTLHTKEPTRTVERHYHFLGRVGVA